MKKVISILLLLTVLLTVAQNAYASEEYNGITCEGITEEEYNRVRYFFGTNVKEEDIGGYIESFDIDPESGQICICYRDDPIQRSWICIYDKNGKFRYGASTTERRLSYAYWVNGKVNIFASGTVYSFILDNHGRLEKIVDCYDTGALFESLEQTKQEIDGTTSRLKKGNIFLPNDYISLVRENDDGSEEVVIRCKHISDGQVVCSTIFSLFIISVILGVISIFVVVFVTWRRDMRAFFAQKRAEGLSEDEIRRQFAEYQREKNERLRNIFSPR